ncbi:efflux RND transporter periplasmic adaptor subunit [Azospirillum sp.]|uniref:efflux RND transporter periplasmic adaptor subunit n=1 Tax=Azospirillum sp. TaxID=34012 RepID=UPI003D70F2B5
MIIRWKPAVAGLTVALVVAGVGYAVQDRLAQPQSGPAAAGRRAFGGPVPVVAGTVGREDVPIWLDGIGTVQAFNSVTVRVRVDGELQQVAFAEGQTVQAGDVLARIDPRPLQAQLAQAEAKKAQDEAQLANARRDLERNLNLREYASKQTVDTQRAQVAQFEALVRSDDAAIETVKVQLGYTTITAPIGGRIGIRGVDQGNIVRASDQNGLATITQVQPISVLFTLPEQALPQVLDAQAAGVVKVVALDRAGRAPLGEGTLAVVDNQIDTGTGTVRLKAVFPNEPQRLWPGQFVNVRLLAAVRKGGTVVPASVVQRGPQGTYAYVIKEDQTVEQRPVKVARSEDTRALVDEGLSPGERVVVDGQYRLQPGARVAASEAAAGNAPPPAAAGEQPRERRRERGEGGGNGRPNRGQTHEPAPQP